MRRLSELTTGLERGLRNFLLHGQTRLRFLSERALARELIGRIRQSSQRVDLARETLVRKTKETLDDARTALTSDANAIQARSPARELAARSEKLQRISEHLPKAFAKILDVARQSFAHRASLLGILGPEATLRRGYSITMDGSGAIIRSTADAIPLSTVRTRLADGEFESEVVPRT